MSKSDIISQKKKLFLGTKNKGKIVDYKNFLSDYKIITPKDIGVDIDIKENDYSIIENSQNKSIQWAKASGIPTISEDTGFFIDELNGKPGVSVKTWGGELNQKLSQEDFLEFIKQKAIGLKDKSCYFYTVVSLGFPDVYAVSITDKNEGYIDTSKFENINCPGYPLSAVFVANGRGKSWSEMSLQEQKDWSKPFIDKIKKLVNAFENELI